MPALAGVRAGAFHSALALDARLVEPQALERRRARARERGVERVERGEVDERAREHGELCGAVHVHLTASTATRSCRRRLFGCEV